MFLKSYSHSYSVPLVQYLFTTVLVSRDIFSSLSVSDFLCRSTSIYIEICYEVPAVRLGLMVDKSIPKAPFAFLLCSPRIILVFICSDFLIHSVVHSVFPIFFFAVLRASNVYRNFILFEPYYFLLSLSIGEIVPEALFTFLQCFLRIVLVLGSSPLM